MPDISKITLPSGNTYDIKDAVAREAIAGGVTFIIAWDGSSTPVVADIPYGVTVTYNDTDYTGTLSAETTGSGTHAQPGAFYLVKSGTTTTGEPNDVYDEYVPVGTAGSKYWEKLGDTQVDLSDVVTGVSLSKQTDTVIGTDATFTITQPTITLAEDSSTGVTFVRGGTTKYMKATATGAAVTPTTTNIKATASGGGAAWNSKDSKTVVTGYASPTSDTFVKSVSAETGKSLVTTTVPNVTGNTSVSIPNVTGNTSVTIPNVTSAGSASTWSFTMGTGDAAETLIIGGGNSTAPTLGTALTATNTTLGTNLTATNTSLGNAITVATGSTSESGTGDAVVTGVTVGDSATAITGLGSPSTASVIGASSTFTNTQPTVSLATGATAGTGVISVATGITSVTQPTITLSNDGVSGTNIAYIESLDTSKKMKGTASGANTAWNNKDSVTALTNATDVSVTKGQ